MWERCWARGKGRLLAVLALGTSVMGGCGRPPGDTELDGDEPRLGAARAALLASFEQAKLTASVPVPDASFGLAVDVQGDTAVVGARAFDPLKPFVGAAFVFERSGGAWSQDVLLVSPVPAPSDNFAASVALDGDTLAVGAPYSPSGKGVVDVFVRASGTWALEAEVSPSDGLGTKAFGVAVALAGDTLLVGDRDGDAAYVMVRSGGAWAQEARLEVAGTDDLGLAVALSGDTALLGATSGAHVLVRTGGAWSWQAELTSKAVWSVAVDGDTAVVGAKGGSGRVFARTGASWEEEANLAALQEESFFSEYFGAMVAIEGERALVGTRLPFDNNPSPGLAYTFRRQGGAWAEEAVITAPDVALNGAFGSTGALSGDTVLLGAPFDKSSGSYAGAAHAFVLVPGLPDGAPCAHFAQCQSGHCTDGVCCDTLCEGTCAACTAAKKGGGEDGACEPIAAGQDPEAECVPAAVGTCGQSGVCDGKGACQLAPGGACDDGDPCTENDSCAAGSCAGEALVCPPPDGCHLAGQCSSVTGACDYPLKNIHVPECGVDPRAASCGCRLASSGTAASGAWALVLGALVFARRRRAERAPVLSPPRARAQEQEGE